MTKKNYLQLDNVQNSEIKFRWIRLGLMAHFEPAVPKAIEMVKPFLIFFLEFLSIYKQTLMISGDRTGSHEIFEAVVPRLVRVGGQKAGGH